MKKNHVLGVGCGKYLQEKGRRNNQCLSGWSQVLIVSMLTLFAVRAHGQTPWLTIQSTNISGLTISTLKTYGISGHGHFLLHGTNVTNISTRVATNRANENGNIFATVLGPTNNSFFRVQSVTNSWMAPRESLISTNIRVIARPEDFIAPTNGTATFVVIVEPVNTNDPNPIQYIWRKNEVAFDIAATNSTLVLTNVSTSDVGFYTVDVRLHPDTNYYRIRSTEIDSPGARLYVYEGSNTAVTGPYQPVLEPTTHPCFTGTYIGYVVLKHPTTGSTLFYKPTSPVTTVVDVDDLTSPGTGYSSIVYYYQTSIIKGCGPTFVHSVSTTTYPTYPWKFTLYIVSGAPALGTPFKVDVNWR